MRDLFWLSDEAWAALEPHLPHNQPGKPRVDDRRVISGILHILKTGGRWRNVPPEYGPAKTIYNRYTRWRDAAFGSASLPKSQLQVPFQRNWRSTVPT